MVVAPTLDRAFTISPSAMRRSPMVMQFRVTGNRSRCVAWGSYEVFSSRVSTTSSSLPCRRGRLLSHPWRRRAPHRRLPRPDRRRRLRQPRPRCRPRRPRRPRRLRAERPFRSSVVWLSAPFGLGACCRKGCRRPWLLYLLLMPVVSCRPSRGPGVSATPNIGTP